MFSFKKWFQPRQSGHDDEYDFDQGGQRFRQLNDDSLANIYVGQGQVSSLLDAQLKEMDKFIESFK